MRKKDWADAEAERLFELVRDGADDDRVIDEIAVSLRRASMLGEKLGQSLVVTGPLDRCTTR